MKQENTFIRIFRWIAVIPVSLVAYTIAYILAILMWRYFSSSIIWEYIFMVLGNITGIIMGGMFGVKIAPNRKLLAKQIICSFFILIGITSIVFGHLCYVSTLQSIISSISIIIASCYILFSNQINLDE